MAENVRPVKADVLVILAGTNDLALGVPFSQTVANLERISRTVGATRVLVSAVPPRDSAQQATVAFNAELRRAVLAHGWLWTDATAGLAEGTRYAPGLSRDGIHPDQAGSAVLGKALAAAMRQAVG
jgi:lysophospholipase L1-like esterase